jgi:hypothetical protein
MERSINRSDYFPELRLTELQRYAKRWAEKYAESIESIVVYNYTPKRIVVYKELWGSFPVRYALVFTVHSDVDEKGLEQLKSDTEQGETVHRGYPALFDNRFFVVYIDKPEDDYHKHWILFLKNTGQEMPLGVLTDEPHWVLYNSRGSNDDSSELRLNIHSNALYTTLPTELFPELIPLEFTKRAREWIEKWPLINEVRLYAGKGTESPYALIIRTADKAALDTSGFWTDSLIPLQQDLSSIYKNKESFSLNHWQIRVIAINEAWPVNMIHNDLYWVFPIVSTAVKQIGGNAPKRKRGPVRGAKLRATEPSQAKTEWLTGSKEICKYVGLSWPTIKKYKKRFGMPIQESPTGRPMAITDDLKSWLASFQLKKKRK